jgi:uncharacterized damage-inducible protein DinB
VSEKDDLLATLQEQRHAILAKLDGLTEEQARRSLVPSGWTPIDLVHHLCTGEQFWIGVIMRGDPVDLDELQRAMETGWGTPDDLTLSVAIDQYREASRESDAFIAEVASADVAPARLPPWEATHHWARSLRTVMLHQIEETARHAGHLDIARELLDDRVDPP